MSAALDADVAAALRAAAVPLRGPDDPADAVLDLVGDARIVLLGDATHGTRDFHRARALITQRLIAERGFAAVAIDGDWPGAWRVNRHVRGQGDDASAGEALAGFRHFPGWLWRNTEVADFIDWLRRFNAAQAPTQRAGFYGLDLYSLQASMDAVQQYLQGHDPAAARRARERQACFDPHGHDPQCHGWLTGLGASAATEHAVVQLLLARHRAVGRPVPADLVADLADAEASFDADRHAFAANGAESHHRAQVLGEVSPWSLRERHLADTLAAVMQHLAGTRAAPRVVVWAHNAHAGDARGTETGQAHGECSLGQRLRELHGPEVVSIGFTTYQGHVTAAADWDAPARRVRLRPALAGSHEALLHATGLPHFLLPLRGVPPSGLQWPRIERAVGAVYRPHTERQSHYLLAQLPAQFDAVIHFDDTEAVDPLDAEPADAPEKAPAAATPSAL